MNEFVTFLNLPALPDWFIDSSKKIILNPDILWPNPYAEDVFNRADPAETVTINDKVFRYGEFYHHELTPLHNQWFVKHIANNIPNPQIGIVTKGDLWPHQDYKCEWSLNYIVDTGGDNVETYWSQERGQPLRPGWKNLAHWRYHKELDEVYSTVVPAKKWVIMPVDIVHGTRNQTSDRILFAIKITTAQANALKENYEFTH